MSDERWSFLWWLIAVAAIVWAVYAWSGGVPRYDPIDPCDAGYRINMAGHTVCNPVGTDGLPVRGPAGY